MLKIKNSQTGFSSILVLILGLILLLFIGLIIASKIKITKEFPFKSSQVQGILLAKGGDDDGSSGGDDKSGSSDNSGSSTSGGDSSSGSGSSGGSGSSNTSGGSSPTSVTNSNATSGSSATSNSGSGSTSTRSENKTPAPGVEAKIVKKISPKVEIENEIEDEDENEAESSRSARIKVKTQNGKQRIDIVEGGIKLRYEIRKDRVIVKAETENGDEVEENEIFKVVDRMDKSGIKVATAGGKLMVQRSNVGALSNFPLQIDLNNNQLIASTSAGIKVLTTLPDQAVQNILAAGVLTKLDTKELRNTLGNRLTVSEVIKLGERKGVTVYEIDGIKDQKLLGIIPLELSLKAFISAESGQTVATEQSLLTEILDLLSF